MELRTIDLFAGIGGIRRGFEDAGFSIIYSNDFDKYAAMTYEANFGEIDTRSIEQVPVSQLPTLDVVIGGFPCQAFSIAGQKKGFLDTRGTLFFHVEKIIAEKKPKAFLLENVGHLLHHDKGKTFETIHSILTKKLGYDVHYKILNAKDFGLPQNRQRIYIVGFKKPTPNFKFPVGNKKKAIKEILEKNVDPKYYISQKYFEGLERHRKRHQDKGNGFGYNVLNLEGVANTLVLGGMGRERNLVQDKVVLPYKKGKDKLKYKNRKGLRRLTIRECARLQGFDDDFVFPVSDTQAYRQIANSVAIPVIREVAKEMRRHL